MHAEHHIFGFQPNGKCVYYSFGGGGPDFSRGLNIWGVKRSFPAFGAFLSLWSEKPRRIRPKTPQAQAVNAVFSSLSAGRPVSRDDLQKTAFLLLSLGPAIFLKAMQAHLDAFSSVLTPQYRELLHRIRLDLPARSELLLHSCNPDLYLWIPPAAIPPTRLIVCFGTKHNSLNAPRPIAHHELARLGVGLLYVGNRPNLDPGNGLPGLTLKASAEQIGSIARSFGFNRLYGLGTSLGGYAACRYANLLKFERLLNFSGFNPKPDAAASGSGDYFGLQGYPRERILSILSRTDPTDQDILKGYDDNHFLTPREWVDSATHGSFSAALIEGKLGGYLDWLLAD